MLFRSLDQVHGVYTFPNVTFMIQLHICIEHIACQFGIGHAMRPSRYMLSVLSKVDQPIAVRRSPAQPYPAPFSSRLIANIAISDESFFQIAKLLSHRLAGGFKP